MPDFCVVPLEPRLVARLFVLAARLFDFLRARLPQLCRGALPLPVDQTKVIAPCLQPCHVHKRQSEHQRKRTSDTAHAHGTCSRHRMPPRDQNTARLLRSMGTSRGSPAFPPSPRWSRAHPVLPFGAACLATSPSFFLPYEQHQRDTPRTARLAQHASHGTPRTARLARHALHGTPRMARLARHASHGTPRTARLARHALH